MRWVLLLCVAMASATLASAQGTELTEKEKRDGMILLFDGKTTFGWTTKGEVQLDDGALKLGAGSKASFNIPLAGPCGLKIVGTVSPIINGSELKIADNERFWMPEGGKAATMTLGITAKDGGLLRSAKYRPSDLKPLFNGDNLNGWTVFPGKKSKFEAKDGEIQLHDGPGDLQTTAKYRNFILQLECKSNGKHLNSGVFFRCRANEYQNGYECQIQNGFAKEKDYTVDVFDPKTHKLLEKRKLLSGAIDYGTGAIYRRVPARSEVAKDHEWFTMTILAVDNHFATWVDGIQETDWTDNRPASDNARNGYRSEAGHISLQGHDPTTNLSFRNIRIQELP